MQASRIHFFLFLQYKCAHDDDSGNHISRACSVGTAEISTSDTFIPPMKSNSAAGRKWHVPAADAAIPPTLHFWAKVARISARPTNASRSSPLNEQVAVSCHSTALKSLRFGAYFVLLNSAQVHTNIIATLKAAGADASILDTNGNSAQDFDLQRDPHGLHEDGQTVGAASGAGRLEPPRTRQESLPPQGGSEEL